MLQSTLTVNCHSQVCRACLVATVVARTLAHLIAVFDVFDVQELGQHLTALVYIDMWRAIHQQVEESPECVEHPHACVEHALGTRRLLHSRHVSCMAKSTSLVQAD